MKIYIAARYSRRAEMEKVGEILVQKGFYITSRWIYGAEEGLSRRDISKLDLEDVEEADMVLSFTEPYGTPVPGGGRHVEFGYGLARGKEMCIIGERENVFHHDPHVFRYTNLEEFLKVWTNNADAGEDR